MGNEEVCDYCEATGENGHMINLNRSSDKRRTTVWLCNTCGFMQVIGPAPVPRPMKREDGSVFDRLIWSGQIDPRRFSFREKDK